MSNLMQHYNSQKSTNPFIVSSVNVGKTGMITNIPNPVNYNANNKGCCPEYGSYNKEPACEQPINNCNDNCNDTCNDTCEPVQTCNTPQEPVYYNMQYTPQEKAYPEMLDICPRPSYKTDAFEIRNGVIMQAGKGITFKQMECSEQMPLGGIIVENNGVRKIGMSGQTGSGITVSNNGTLSEPNFIFNVNKNDLRDYTGYTTEIIVNGRSYKPILGIIDISGGAFGSPITNLKSPNSTISITAIGPGVAGLDVKPIKVNSITLQPDNAGHLVNIVNGNNTTVSVDSNNNVAVNVSGAVTSVNGQTGAVSIPTLSPTEVFQGFKTLNSGDATSLTSTGLNLSSLTPTSGTIPSTFVASKAVLYKNGTYMTLADYSFSGTTATSTMSFVAGDKLSWLIFKN